MIPNRLSHVAPAGASARTVGAAESRWSQVLSHCPKAWMRSLRACSHGSCDACLRGNSDKVPSHRTAPSTTSPGELIGPGTRVLPLRFHTWLRRWRAGITWPGPSILPRCSTIRSRTPRLTSFASRSKRSKTSVLSRRKEGQAARACKKQGRCDSHQHGAHLWRAWRRPRVHADAHPARGVEFGTGTTGTSHLRGNMLE